MITNHDRRMLARRIAIACCAGVLLALPSFSLCFDLAAAGYGSSIAFYVFFGPIWVIYALPPAKSGAMFSEVFFLIAGMLALYGIYGGLLALERSRGRAMRAFFVILCLHYGAVAWMMFGSGAKVDFTRLAETVAEYSLLRAVVTVDLWIALHILAFQYARSSPPYRPRMTWPAAALLAVGLLIGVALFAWGAALS